MMEKTFLDSNNKVENVITLDDDAILVNDANEIPSIPAAINYRLPKKIRDKDDVVINKKEIDDARVAIAANKKAITDAKAIVKKYYLIPDTLTIGQDGGGIGQTFDDVKKVYNKPPDTRSESEKAIEEFDNIAMSDMDEEFIDIAIAKRERVIGDFKQETQDLYNAKKAARARL